MEEQPIASTSSVANESSELQMSEIMLEVSTGRICVPYLLEYIELSVVAGTVDTVEGRCLTTDLREFCLRAKLSLTTAKDLFQVLRHYHPELPNDPRTLLQTPQTCVSKSMKRGKYVHLGLERGLLNELRLRTLTGIPEVHVQLHIDGMKVFKASAQCLWPILARINHPVVGQPFVVGVFCGFGKPEPLEDVMGDCVSELKGLLTTGLRDPRTESVIKVDLLNVICDTPPRCYVRQVKAHNGYYGCDRHIRKLTSDSDNEDSPNQPKEPTGWPAPPPILHKSMKRGKYVHLGLERGLLNELRLRTLTGIPEVHVQLPIDGMKVFKASAQCLWPILARINHPVVGQPFVVGVFCGFGKPEPLEDVMGDCVSELKGLLTTGLRDPRTESVIKVDLLNVICDTPARCYVRQVNAHNGYYGCDRHIRKLTSDSDNEDSPNQPKEPTGWPAPPPILQKRNDFLAEQLMGLHSSVQQLQATLSDVVNALQTASSAGSVTSSSLNLRLCTEEAYESFLRRLSVDDGFANEASKQLAVVGGRSENDFVRNLLTALIGPPLCYTFCRRGGSKEKRSFLACPLVSILNECRNSGPRKRPHNQGNNQGLAHGTTSINRCVAPPAAYQSLRAQLSERKSKREPKLNMNPNTNESMADTHPDAPQPGSDEGAVVTTAVPFTSPADEKADSAGNVNKIASRGRQHIRVQHR
ncbi:hypothetical protein SprV_0401713000 [Sparganum proliferum]